MNTAGFDPVTEGAVPSSSANIYKNTYTARGRPWTNMGSPMSRHEQFARTITTKGMHVMDEAIWDGYYDDDEMTEADWDRYSREFEARYNEHLNSIKSSSPRRVGRSTASHYYDEEDGLGSLLPTEEEINRYRRALGCDERYNLEQAFCSMCRPHEDTMAAFFLESQW